jgi:hypothetical protein
VTKSQTPAILETSVRVNGTELFSVGKRKISGKVMHGQISKEYLRASFGLFTTLYKVVTPSAFATNKISEYATLTLFTFIREVWSR